MPTPRSNLRRKPLRRQSSATSRASRRTGRRGFRLGSYDPARLLLLDPTVIVYAGYIGGSGDEVSGGGIAVDGSGAAYVTGTTTSTEASFPVVVGPDTSFNGAYDAFAAKISPNQPPDCSQTYPSQDLLWPPNHQFVPINILGVMDPDGDAMTVTINTIRQDEALNAKGSGNTAPDGQVVDSTALVRAERVGDPKAPGNGRVYHIGFTAADAEGASCTGEVLVGVPHDQGGYATPIDDGLNYDSTQP